MSAVTFAPIVSGASPNSGFGLHARRVIGSLTAGRASAAARQLRPYEAALREISARYGEPANRPSAER
ncbi:hypothetical protein [Microvirga sp. 17 mud 1-3]|uniref:hypothetical protein n=1 Tax=Microvirga sp. 17 mud 1-3 TaxID=2082949 RepID=UPI0013A596BF|nr:hypothetical protein [Microvirga sp. 17 mud 1-3]